MIPVLARSVYANFLEAQQPHFEELPHRYTKAGPPGRELIHVTHILKKTGVSLDFERLVTEGKLSADDLAYKRDLGRAAHMATHYHDEGELASATIADPVQPRLQAWMKFREFTGFTPMLLETPICHPTLDVAGTLDRAGYFAKFSDHSPNDLIVVDIKLGDPDDAGAFWQTAAYAEFLAVNLEKFPGFDASSFRLRPRYSVQLLDNGNYKMHRYDNHMGAWRDFQAFVTTFRRQHAQRTGREK